MTLLALLGFFGITLGAITHIDWPLYLGAGMIGLDVVVELRNLNINLQILVNNQKAMWERFVKKYLE